MRRAPSNGSLGLGATAWKGLTPRTPWQGAMDPECRLEAGTVTGTRTPPGETSKTTEPATAGVGEHVVPPAARSRAGHVSASQAWPDLAAPAPLAARPGSNKTGTEGGLPTRSGPGRTLSCAPDALRRWTGGVPLTSQGAPDRSEKTKPPINCPPVKPSTPVNRAAKSFDAHATVPGGTTSRVGAAPGAGFRGDQGTTLAALLVPEVVATVPPHPARTLMSTTPTSATARGRCRRSPPSPRNRAQGPFTCRTTPGGTGRLSGSVVLSQAFLSRRTAGTCQAGPDRRREKGPGHHATAPRPFETVPIPGWCQLRDQGSKLDRHHNPPSAQFEPTATGVRLES